MLVQWHKRPLIVRRFRLVYRVIRRKKRRTTRSISPLYLKNKEATRVLVLSRIEHFNQFYLQKIGRVSIRNQKTRWGSCSRKGNLNFNYRLSLVSPHLADYVIVHELCHLIEFSHSKTFWALVAKTIPDYAERRAQLRKIRLS